MNIHVCTNHRDDVPVVCVCDIGRNHDEYEFQAWENNNWQDPKKNIHHHEWTDATNSIITSGEVCFECGAIRSDNEDRVTATYLKAFVQRDPN